MTFDEEYRKYLLMKISAHRAESESLQVCLKVAKLERQSEEELNLIQLKIDDAKTYEAICLQTLVMHEFFMDRKRRQKQNKN